MNLSELRTRIRSLIREPRENFIRDDELNAWFNDMSYECTKDLLYPWKEWTVHGIEEQADYTVPTDFIQVHPLLNVMFGDERAEKRDVVWLEHTDPNYRSATGVDYPDYHYFRFQNKLSFYPPLKLIASGSATAGSATTTLIDAAASFASSYVGHSIRNITDGSNALITAVTSTTQLTATLSGGSDNNWTSGDTYKINRAGYVPYLYRETAMAENTETNVIATEFPYLLIYRVFPLADIKVYRTDSASQSAARIDRIDKLSQVEYLRAKKFVSEKIRGHNNRTISPSENTHG
jgi:hypothetical protein